MLRFIQKTKINNTFTQLKQRVAYPYLFGGLPLSTYPVKQQFNQELIVMMQGKEIKLNFRQAYLSFLDGLLNQDRQFLSGILSRQLFDNLTFQNVKLINVDKPVREEIDKEYLVMGAGFDRNLHVGPWRLLNNQSENQRFKMYKTEKLGTKFPILFSVEVYFKSKMKLTTQNMATDPNTEQIHMIQFECERKQYTAMSIFSIGITQFWKSLFDRSKNYDMQCMKRILDLQNCQWKIGDVDRLLDGNFSRLRKDQNKNQ